jgi:hypothetical protein
MATETGRLEKIAFRAEPDQRIEIRGRLVVARHFAATQDGQPELWYGPHDTLLMFSIVDDGERVTFVLR